MPKSRAVYQIKIVLADINPPVWRHIQVWGDMTLAQLHAVMQVVMDWENYHLHDFLLGKRIYSVADPDDCLHKRRVFDESKHRRSAVLP